MRGFFVELILIYLHKIRSMKKLYFAAVIGLLCSSVQSQIINFPDANFKAKLVSANTSNNIAAIGNNNSVIIDTNSNGEIEVSEAVVITGLYVGQSSISDLTGLEYFTSLEILQCSENQITTFSSAGMGNLEWLFCNSNQLISIDFSGFSSALESVEIVDNQLTQINLPTGLSNFWSLDAGGNPFAVIDLTPVAPSLKTFGAINSGLTSLDLSAMTTLKTVAVNGSPMTSLILCPSIEMLNCRDSQLTSLDLTGTVNLNILICGNNQISFLDLTQSPNLKVLSVFQNPLGNLDLSHLPLLDTLVCSNIGMTTLDLTSNPLLVYLTCGNNNITTLDVSMFPNMFNLNCSGTQITSLDVSNNPELTYLNCKNIPGLLSLNIKNGLIENSLDFSNCPLLEYVCADESQMTDVETKIVAYGYTNCLANSYCTFEPGGADYAITGNVRYDATNNGCNTSDANVPVKINMANGTVTGTVFTNANGAYTLPVAAGSHTMTPVLEMPSYFSISPVSTSVNFPATTSPATRNFCIVKNGNHSDIEVFMIPATRPRAGFDVKYRIVYRNKGTATVSAGSIMMTYNGTFASFISATPAEVGQSAGNIAWSYTNLQPFESRVINLTLHLNGPSDTPPLFGGENFTSTLTINPSISDEFLDDNAFSLPQTVINSFDPNDKTCLEGNIVGPEMVGKFVHYVIRFENTGTAEAENIVIKDIIDTTKYDIASLVPLNGSHAFTTRITETNKVEFIFENINLPFDDANNDGYVAFKIKTKPTLVIGDTFSNNASIYFDYNFPIVTNTATTAIQLLGNPDFEFSDAFVLYPNPVRNNLGIRSKNGIEVKSAGIYNMLGQLVLVETGSVSAIDVSALQAGQYFVKVHSNRGNAVAKFIKQ